MCSFFQARLKLSPASGLGDAGGNSRALTRRNGGQDVSSLDLQNNFNKLLSEARVSEIVKFLSKQPSETRARLMNDASNVHYILSDIGLLEHYAALCSALFRSGMLNEASTVFSWSSMLYLEKLDYNSWVTEGITFSRTDIARLDAASKKLSEVYQQLPDYPLKQSPSQDPVPKQ